ncbi:MAG: helix-turn-helix domain-containing protein [Chloroflexi bacterium]|nr:helix-turn-helix domain-containing protein [Chloroflexota bacterium]
MGEEGAHGPNQGPDRFGTAGGRAPEAAERPWLSLGQASFLLGVNETTLRRWADEGRVRVLYTPGGHRRFAQEDLGHLLVAKRRERKRPPLARVVQREYERYKTRHLTDVERRPWYHLLSDETRERLRQRGRQVLGEIETYLGRPGSRDALLGRLRSFAAEYGRELAQHGLSPADGLEAFLFFRHRVLDAARRAARPGGPLSQQGADAMQECSDLLDEMALPLVEALQRAEGEIGRGKGEG